MSPLLTVYVVSPAVVLVVAPVVVPAVAPVVVPAVVLEDDPEEVVVLVVPEDVAEGPLPPL